MVVLMDAQWAVLEPLIEACRPHAKVPPSDLRRRWRPSLALHEWGKVALDPDRPDAYFIPSSKMAAPSTGAAITDEARSAAPISALIITLSCLLCWFL